MNRRTFFQWLGGIGAALVAPKVAALPDDSFETDDDWEDVDGFYTNITSGRQFYVVQGARNGDGSFERPFGSIAEALSHAQAGGSGVVCGKSYDS